MNEMPEAKPQVKTSNDVWAIVALMGHKKYAGRLTQEEQFGGKVGRVDCPTKDGFTTVYFTAQSLYSCQIVSEQVARDEASRSSDIAPVQPWQYPKQLASAESPNTARVREGIEAFDNVEPAREDACDCSDDEYDDDRNDDNGW